MPASAAQIPSPLSLYIHVPFCRSRCRYCAFSSRALSSGCLDRYVPALLREIALWGEHFSNARPAVSTVFFGGGTPSLLPPVGIVAIMEALRSVFWLEPGAEITMEANPDSATTPFFQAARMAGVNRLSLGVQSLDDRYLSELGRPHTALQARQTVAAARAAGFDNLGLDLIWGLPGQTAAHWLETLRAAIALGPDHLSCYGLMLEPGTPLADAVAQARPGQLPLPEEAVLERMYLEGGALLDHAGFAQYEISNYSLPGRRCRHNLLCWQGGDYIGFGPAAVSTLTGPVNDKDSTHVVRWTNPDDPDDWAGCVAAGHIGGQYAGDREDLTAVQRRQERVMLGLRTCLGAALSDMPFSAGLMLRLQQENLARVAEGRLFLTRRGMLVSNSIIEALAFD